QTPQSRSTAIAFSSIVPDWPITRLPTVRVWGACFRQLSGRVAGLTDAAIVFSPWLGGINTGFCIESGCNVRVHYHFGLRLLFDDSSGLTDDLTTNSRSRASTNLSTASRLKPPLPC